jgi:DNA-binding transcriptional MerR regulator
MSDVKLTNPNLLDVVSRARFSAAQVCDMTGISRRQLYNWEDCGYLGTSEGDDDLRGFDLATVERIILIRQAMESGLSLQKAAMAVDDYLQNRTDASPAVAPAAPVAPQAPAAGELAFVADLLRQTGQIIRSMTQLRSELIAFTSGGMEHVAEVRKRQTGGER